MKDRWLEGRRGDRAAAVALPPPGAATIDDAGTERIRTGRFAGLPVTEL